MRETAMTSAKSLFQGDDASPEVMDPTLEILRDLNLDLEFIFPLVGAEAIEQTGERFPERVQSTDRCSRGHPVWLNERQQHAGAVLPEMGQANLCQCQAMQIHAQRGVAPQAP